MNMKSSIFINKLKKIRNLNNKNHLWVNENLYRLIINPEALTAAYQQLKENPGALTPATEQETFDRWSKKKQSALHEKLKNESWKPKKARRIYIPKAGKVEKRPLGIHGPEEKIVQTSLKMVLEAIYEPIFTERCYGFREGIGVHNALKSISEKYDAMTFAIQGDIKGMYDSVNHHKLIELLERKIKDTRVIRLIWKLLRAGYMDTGKIINSLLGTPQGSTVSPVLLNIYLHELDIFMKDIIEDTVKCSSNIKTPPFKKIQAQMRKGEKAIENSANADSKKRLIKQWKNCKKQSLQIRPYCDPSEKIHYTRYADNFIIATASCESKTIAVKNKIKEFLKTLHLTLNEEKTKITNLRKENALFLGHQIKINTRVKIKRSSFPGKFIIITAPIENIIQRLHEKGFCDRKGNPIHKSAWISQQDNQIIDLYNATSRGVFGFYSRVDCKSRLTRIKYIFKFSCASTLAAKHRTSLKKIFSKHGPDLKVVYGSQGERKISLFQPCLKKVANQ